MKDRAQHIAWCQKRALAKLDRKGVEAAATVLIEDVWKHPETGSLSQPVLLAAAQLIADDDTAGMRRLIEEFGA